jgi:aspartate ammonia-lyase
MTIATRSEHDLIGDRDVPLEAYWGVHTLRALENFPITGIPIGTSPFLVEALAAVKEAAATANHDLGLLDDERSPRSATPARRSEAASCATSSSSTSSRAAPARRPT